MLTLGDASQHVLYSLGLDSFPEHLSGAEIVNQAGRWLASVHPWKFLAGAETHIDFVANQDYALLPADTGEVLAIDRADGFHSSFEWTTQQGMVDLRTTTPVAATFHWWGVVVYTASATDKKPAPRIDLYPTPTTSLPSALKVRYRRKWAEATKDSDPLYVPDYVEALLIQTAIAFGRGYVEEDVAPLDVRLSQILAGPLYAAAVAQDGRIQRDYGRISGGAAEITSRRRHFDNTVGNPSP